LNSRRIPDHKASAMDEHSIERAVEMLAEMVASCARMVASLTHASAVLAQTRSAHGFLNPNFD